MEWAKSCLHFHFLSCTMDQNSVETTPEIDTLSIGEFCPLQFLSKTMSNFMSHLREKMEVCLKFSQERSRPSREQGWDRVSTYSPVDSEDLTCQPSAISHQSVIPWVLPSHPLCHCHSPQPRLHPDRLHVRKALGGKPWERTHIKMVYWQPRK